MTKSLSALFALSALPALAMANVTLYGTADAGINYFQQKSDKNPWQATDVTTRKTTLGSGLLNTSRIGLKGEEALGDLTVGFQLESGFDLTTGDLREDIHESTTNRLFNREARVFVRGDFGELSAGRMGVLSTDGGRLGIIQRALPVNFFDNELRTGFVYINRLDNVLSYSTPTMDGVQAHVVYANGQKSGKGWTDDKNATYTGLGLTYTGEKLNVAGALEFSKAKKQDTQPKQARVVIANLAANYDFDSFKAFAALQYAKSQYRKNYVIDTTRDDDRIMNDGRLVGVILGASTQVYGGTLTGQASFRHYKPDNYKYNSNRTTVMGRYVYPLSNRTDLYSSVGLGFEDYKPCRYQSLQAYAGVSHRF